MDGRNGTIPDLDAGATGHALQKSTGLLFDSHTTGVGKQDDKGSGGKQPKANKPKRSLVTDKIARYVWIGRKDIDWYVHCENLFVEIFGREELPIVTRLFAATSINSQLQSNIRLFRKAYYEMKNNLPVGDYLPVMKLQIERVRRGEELSGRKINSFARAMAGWKDAVVVDLWLMRAFGISKQYKRKAGPHADKMRDSSPSNAQYTLVENFVRQEARAMGIEPRQLSAMIWSGVRIAHTGNKDTHYRETLKRNLTNLFDVI